MEDHEGDVGDWRNGPRSRPLGPEVKAAMVDAATWFCLKVDAAAV